MNLIRRNKNNEYSKNQRSRDINKINSNNSISTNMDNSFSN
jgi:hypothetical protein